MNIRHISISCAAAMLVSAGIASAQTPEEQEELDAAAAGGSGEAPDGQVIAPLDCGPGSVATTLSFSDFEGGTGGWTGGGAAPWEHGAPVLGVHEGCDNVPEDEPAGAFSGSNVWATNLNGCYANSDSESLLTQTFDLSDAATPARMVWWNWYEVFIPFDMAEVVVNDGAPLFEVTTVAPTAGYLQQAVDLSAFAGNPSVTIDFRLFATSVVNRSGWYIDDVTVEYCEEVDQARFQVSKDFEDDNTAEVEVTLSCNTGLPLEQTTTISEGDPVNFVVGDYETGTLDCEITETVPAGYTASYDDGTVSADNCSYEDLIGGQQTCAITNNLDAVDVEVTKVWIDANPQFNNQNVAGASWSCSNVAFGPTSGFLNFNGNPDTQSFSVYPDWDTGTSCAITEVDLFESGVEVEDSECQGLVVSPGEGATCTIYNTRLYQGIPTLSPYGLGVLALLLLGLGFVAVRRMA